MYDQLGGGFARYSVDERWLVPHFEKMLYDNAQLARVYLQAWQLTGNDFYRRVAEETLDYVLLEMRHEEGGFYSSQDADSEGVEGKFYVWSADEIREALGEDADVFMQIYGVSDEGNWEGQNILNLRLDPKRLAAQLGIDAGGLGARMAAARAKLYELRSKRVWPGLDDKVLTSWNGLMLAAFAEAGQALRRPDYIEAARSNADFLHRTMRRDVRAPFPNVESRLRRQVQRVSRRLRLPGRRPTGPLRSHLRARWIDWARELAELMLAHFRDTKNGGFFDTSDDHEQLIHRPKDLQDNAVPSGNSMAASVLSRLSLLTGNGDYWQVAEQSTATMSKFMSQYPSGFGQWLNVASFMLSEPREIALVGSADAIAPLLEVARDGYQPFQVVAAGDGKPRCLYWRTDPRSTVKGRRTSAVSSYARRR